MVPLGFCRLYFWKGYSSCGGLRMGWNLESYDDGRVSEESFEVFQQAASAVRKLYPKETEVRNGTI
jgi:hypothetical protein